MVGGKFVPSLWNVLVKFRDFVEHLLRTLLTFNLSKFSNFRALFPAVSMDVRYRELVFIKT